MKRLASSATLVLGMVIALGASAAKAEWKRAETPRFIVYSDGDQGQLRDAALQLELFESAMRMAHRMDPSGKPARRIAIYLVRDQAALKQVEPELRDGVAGFYQATDDDIFALAIRERRDQSTLLHEYAHHFMMGSLTGGFPAWFVEGYAEYFANAEISSRRVVVGGVNRNSGEWLNYASWMPMNLLLTRRPFEFSDSNAVTSYYAQSWLLAHWFISDPDRLRMFYAYMANLRQGQEPVAAMEAAVGMPIGRLERVQRDYLRQNFRVQVATSDNFPRPDVQIASLSPAESDLLLSGLRLSSTFGKDDALLADIRRRAAAYPDDPFAILLLARAELRLGDRAAARRLLSARLDEAPEDAVALRLMGEAVWDDAKDNASDQLTLVREARGYLAKAYALEPDDYRTLYLLAETRQVSPDFPSDNDVETLLAALDLAPQSASLRLFTAQARAKRGEYDAAINLLQPLASNPHSSGATVLARGLITRYQQAMVEKPSDEDATDDPAPSAG